MKSILLSMVLLLTIIGSAIAGPIRTALNLRMFDGRPISVMVAGVLQGPVASQQEILNLAPGVHRLKVFTVQTNPFGWNSATMIPVYRGTVEVFGDYAVIATVDRFNRLIIEDYEALLMCEPVPPVCGTAPVHFPGNYPPNHGGSPYPGGDHGGWNNQNGGGWNGNNGGGWSGNNGGNWNGSNGGGWNSNYRAPMNQNDFNQLLKVIESKSFESTKQEIALGEIANNYFTSEQIKQMLGLFTFESTKVEVAKKAYDRVIDQDKYYVVYDSFTFESSISELVSLHR